MWRLSNLLYRLFHRPTPGEVLPTVERQVVPKVVPRRINFRGANVNPPPRYSKPQAPLAPPYRSSLPTPSDDDGNGAALAAAVLAHSLRFDPQPERFHAGGGSFGGGGASGGWDEPAQKNDSWDVFKEKSEPSYTPSSSDTSFSCGSDSSSSDSSSSSE